MKHLIYGVVAASALGFSAGAFACGAQHTASASRAIVVAQQQVQGTPSAQGPGYENKSNGALAGQNKPTAQ
jgi:hypothetical protein